MNYTRQYDSKRIDCENDKCGEWHQGGHELESLLPVDTYTIIYGDKKWSYCVVCDMAASHGSYVHFQCRQKLALRVARVAGEVETAPHKQWVVDQMLRSLLDKDQYAAWVKKNNDNPWDIGIAP